MRERGRDTETERQSDRENGRKRHPCNGKETDKDDINIIKTYMLRMKGI